MCLLVTWPLQPTGRKTSNNSAAVFPCRAAAHRSRSTAPRPVQQRRCCCVAPTTCTWTRWTGRCTTHCVWSSVCWRAGRWCQVGGLSVLLLFGGAGEAGCRCVWHQGSTAGLEAWGVPKNIWQSLVRGSLKPPACTVMRRLPLMLHAQPDDIVVVLV